MLYSVFRIPYSEYTFICFYRKGNSKQRQQHIHVSILFYLVFVFYAHHRQTISVWEVWYFHMCCARMHAHVHLKWLALAQRSHGNSSVVFHSLHICCAIDGICIVKYRFCRYYLAKLNHMSQCSHCYFTTSKVVWVWVYVLFSVLCAFHFTIVKCLWCNEEKERKRKKFIVCVNMSWELFWFAHSCQVL